MQQGNPGHRHRAHHWLQRGNADPMQRANANPVGRRWSVLDKEVLELLLQQHERSVLTGCFRLNCCLLYKIAFIVV